MKNRKEREIRMFCSLCMQLCMRFFVLPSDRVSPCSFLRCTS